jgi:hypothetical protein
MDINKASAEQLEQAFQVDGTRARYLVERRNAMGGFQSWEDVKRVPGFEDKIIPPRGFCIVFARKTANQALIHGARRQVP